MSSKIALPNSEWALLRSPEEVKERQRRPLVNLQRRLLGSGVGEALMSAGTGVDEKAALETIRPLIGSPDFEMLDEISDLLIVALTEDWSFDLPISVDGVLDLPNGARTALVAACEPLVGPLTGQVSEDELLDPASPTEPGHG